MCQHPQNKFLATERFDDWWLDFAAAKSKSSTSGTAHLSGMLKHGLRASQRSARKLARLVIVASLLAGTDVRGEKSAAPSTKCEFEYDGDFLRNLSGGLQQGNTYNGFIKLGETPGFGGWLDPADESSSTRIGGFR